MGDESPTTTGSNTTTFDELRERHAIREKGTGNRTGTNRRGSGDGTDANSSKQGYFQRQEKDTNSASPKEEGFLKIGDRANRATTQEEEPFQDRVASGKSKTAKPSVTQRMTAATREAEAAEMSNLLIMMLSNFGVMYAKDPEGALSTMEQMLIAGPLATWLSTPAIFNKASKNMMPILALSGLTMYGLRVSMLRQTNIKREKDEKLASTPRVPTIEFTPERPGQVDPQIFTNGTTDPSVMEDYLTNQPEVIPNIGSLNTSLFG